MGKPKPVPISAVCSKCGLPWDDHGQNPSLKTCVALLKAALTRSAVPEGTICIVGDSGPERFVSTSGTVTALRRDDDPPDMGVPAVV